MNDHPKQNFGVGQVNKAMLMEKERAQLVEYGKMLITQHLTTGTGGNLSIYDPQTGLMAITPSGIGFFETKPEDIVIMNLEGEVVEGIRKPSSEVDMHRIFYKHRTDVTALVHTHSTFATTIACMGWDIEPIHYVIGVAGGNVRCTPYTTFGTWELAESALEGMKDRSAVLLGNHGLIAGGGSIDDAFGNARSIEFISEIYCRTQALGGGKILSDSDLDVVLKKFKTYGQQDDNNSQN